MISNFLVRLWLLRIQDMDHRGSILVTLPVAVLSFLSFAFGMAFTVESFLHSSFAAMHGISFLVYIPLAIAAASDICMTAALCFFLYTNRTGIRRTDSIINVLMLYCINASLLTTCLNIVCFVTFLALPTNYIFMALFFVSSKLYFCSLLATLNAREMFRQKATAVSLPSLRSKQLRSMLPTLDADRKEASLPVSVTVNTASHTHVDSVVDLTDSKGTGSSMMMSDMNSVDSSRHA
ncbi:hypothetical protein M0805_007744 [Coniferiporia weirii]|nr:hypothetical protein M0805_007744 [Coniferiporia weirii]